DEAADRILADVHAADASVAGLEEAADREFRATTTDLKILAYLARYHASRMKAAVWYNVYLQSKDRSALERCIVLETQAIDRWKKIIESAGDVYPETLKFGVHRVGFSWHWKEELAKLEEGLQALRKLPSQATLDADVQRSILRQELSSAAEPISIHVARAPLATPGQNLTITATAESKSGLRWIRLRYRHLTQFEDYATVDMTRDRTTGDYAATIPGSFIVPEWDLMYFVEAVDQNGNGRMVPDLEAEMPYVIVPVKR
ncbi:MAG: hypothetical protein JJ992_07705, partial [Planctomycetes bacterium]|nr:hypothetical protein [Planctomycetota bacterium]